MVAEIEIVRRRRGSLTAAVAPAALTAASAPVTDINQVFKRGAVGRRKDWQAEAWEFMQVGEFRSYVRWRAGCCSKVRLVASEIDAETGTPTGGISDDNAEGKRFAEMVRSIAGGPLGQAQLIKRSAEQLCVPGEYWVAILNRTEVVGGEKRQVQQWYAVTRKEIQRGTRKLRDGSDSAVIKLPDGTKHDFDPGNGDGLFRVWNPDPEDASEPDSPVRAVQEPLRTIIRTSKKIDNADLQRLVNAGLLVLPQEANLPTAQAPVSANKPAGSPAQTQPPQRIDQRLQQALVQAATTAGQENYSSMVSLVPMIMSAPGEFIDKIKLIEFGSEVTKTALETIEKAIGRLAMGLDMAPEQLLGLGSTSNHWNSFLLEDQDVQMYVSPLMETICQALYDNVLRNTLAKEGIEPGKYTLWYDTSRLTADPDLTDEAKAAFDGGHLRGEALLRYLGLSDEDGYDLTTLEGAQVWARDAVLKDPSLLNDAGIRSLLGGELEKLEWPEPARELPAGRPSIEDGDDDHDESRADRHEAPSTERDAGRPVVAAFGGPLRMALDLMVTRCLDLAASRRVTTSDRAQYARLRDIPKDEWHRYMDPVSADQVPRLIKGWDAGLDRIATDHGLDADEIRLLVQGEARRQLTSALVDGQVL